MGIQEEDIARVRAATDFVALAGEHIALKRVGRQYQGLCPFHSEKSPSFSINPEKGVYYCYGCQASGDVISFVRQLEHLDFSAAVERLAAKANITLQYDNEAGNRDRVRRAKLVEAMESAVDWYHQRLLIGADGGAARAYLRGRGYDGELIRRFRIGYAPEGWDTLNRALAIPSDVARDTGLGFVNKVGKVNDFFQKRIVFPIFDQSGTPVAFGGRKLPIDDGPKYKNSSETKLYSKSRTLYGLNWAKADIVQSGEVIVCEGYTDVIGFHTAGLPRAVATCGTALADEHFKMLKNYARRIVLAYDADNAGQNAAAKFFNWEKLYEIDLHVVTLPDGADPADLARNNPEALHEAVKSAKPFLAFRVERVLREANLKTPEGRAKAFVAASAVVSEHPNAIVKEQYLRDIAGRCQVSESQMIAALQVPAVPSKHGAPGRPRGVAEHGGQQTARQQNGGQMRAVQNEDWSERPPEEASYRAAPARRTNGSSAANSVGGIGARASSPSLRAEALLARSRRAEEELLRWLVQDPERVSGWLHTVLFVDAIHAEAVATFRKSDDLHAAIDASEAENRDDVAQLLRRLAVDAPTTDDFDDALAIVAGNTTDRVIAAISASRELASADEISAIGDLKRLREDLRESERRAFALTQLVPWLTQWHDQHQEEAPS